MSESIFTTQFKRKAWVTAGLLLLVAGTVPFAAGLVIITYLLPSTTGTSAGLVTALALVVGLLLPWVSYQRLALFGNGYLRRSVAQKWEQAGHSLPATTFVGFSPGSDLRMWEGETDQDVGFLELAAGALIYRGDSFSWSLRRENISSIDLKEEPGTPQRIVVHWHTPGQPGRAFTLASREVNTLSGAQQATRTLHGMLGQWYDAASSAGPVPTLGSPPTSLAGSIPVEKLPAGACLSILSVVVITVLMAWYMAQQFIDRGFYYHAVLWAGLIVVAAMIFISYFLSYLQAAEARASQPNTT